MWESHYFNPGSSPIPCIFINDIALDIDSELFIFADDTSSEKPI